MKYNYNKLKGIMKEKEITQETLSKLLNISETSINNKLNNKVFFKQDEIDEMVSIFNIKSKDIQEIFFAREVE